MGTIVLRFVVVGGVWLMAASPVLGHHFFPRESDTPISITGTVTKFEMRNPHSLIVLEVRDGSGLSSAWTIELGSLQNLITRGWERTSLKPGDVIAVEAIVGNGKANAAAARHVSLPDGRVLFAGSHIGDNARR